MGPTDDELLALAERVGAVLRTRGLTVATVESCTGGLVAHLLTEIPGASDYVRGGLVTYSNEAKARLAGVPIALLDEHGAVSAPVAAAMATGGRVALDADVAVAITGIAGPTGGTDTKPIGLTFVAVAGAAGAATTDEAVTRRFVWELDRAGNKRASAAAALALVLERLDA